MTHDEIIKRVMRWLRNSRRHVVVLSEIGSAGCELPDVIGWTHRGLCTLVECKVSRSDFLRDAKKHFRTENGMGQQRWYATPSRLVKLGEVPFPWGLIEVGPKVVRMVREPHNIHMSRNLVGETACLISAMQRVTEGWGRKVFGEISPVHGQLDPHPTVAAALKAYRSEIHSLRSKLTGREERLARLEEELRKAREVV